MKERINRLKQEKDAVILAHYYVPAPVQEVADYIGDSYALAKAAKETTAKVLVFCGVNFMGESAKLLNPQKTVLINITDDNLSVDFLLYCYMGFCIFHVRKP